ncbi:MAG: hypothetical protein IT265_05670 [Saprospiraceae bacterium]|nr:hypothetical protein [Saprospiraceae bacterium]
MFFPNEPYLDETEENPLRFLEFAFSIDGVQHIHDMFEFTQITDEWGGLPVYDKTRDFIIYSYFDERIGKDTTEEYFFWDHYNFLVNEKVESLLKLIDKLVIKLIQNINVKTFLHIIIGRVQSMLNSNEEVDSIEYKNIKNTYLLHIIESLQNKYSYFIEAMIIKSPQNNFLKWDDTRHITDNIKLLQNLLIEGKFIKIVNTNLMAAMNGELNSKSKKVDWIFNANIKNKGVSKIPLLYLIRKLIEKKYINEFSKNVMLYSALDNSFYLAPEKQNWAQSEVKIKNNFVGRSEIDEIILKSKFN